MTEAGAEYLGRVETALAALDEAEQAARGTGELRGVLRVAASSSFTERALISRLDEFLVRNPKLRMVLLVNDQRQALVTEGVDVAFRFGSLAIEGAAVLPRCALAQPNGLERFSALDIVRRYPPDLRDKSPALLRVSQAF